MERTCETCKHETKSGFRYPCNCCDYETHDYDYWEPKEEKEKEKKTMDRRTKVQLLEAIEEKDAEIKDLKEEIKKLEQYDLYKKNADELKLFTSAYVEAGFTEEQAFELLKAMIPAVAAATMQHKSKLF